MNGPGHGRHQAGDLDLAQTRLGQGRPIGIVRTQQGKIAKTLGQTGADHQPHHQKRIRFMLPDFINWDDVRMIQLGGSLCFAAKSGQGRRRRQFPDPNHFHRDNPIQRDLAGPIHNSHSAASDLFQDFVPFQAQFAPGVHTRIRKPAVITVQGVARKPKVQ
jgi:hypothetical protein